MQGVVAPILQAIIPLDAVPGRLQSAVSRELAGWGYSWEDITFAGTARVPGASRDLEEQWVFAISAEPLAPGDGLMSGGGRGAGLSVGRFASGVLPSTPYLAYVYERLGGRGGGLGPQPQSPPPPPTTADTAPATQDPLR